MADLPRNNFKHAIVQGKQQLGLWLSLVSPIAAEVAATAGFDWVLIDMEHAPIDLGDLAHTLRALHGGTAEPIVRIPWNDPVQVKRLLDLGVRSIMFPMVQSAKEANDAVRATRYPPQGIRGVFGGGRASLYGRVPDYLKRAAGEICVIVQIETAKAIDAIPEIAAIDGVDGLFIGPSDLAADLGIVGQRYDQQNKDQIQRGLELIRKSGKASGIIETNQDEAVSLIKSGFTFVAVGSDLGLVARGTENLIKTYKPLITG